MNRAVSPHVVEHPVLSSMLAALRDERTPPAIFRGLVRRAGLLLAYEATRTLPTRTRRVRTPMAECEATEAACPLVIVPILRAGLPFADGMLDLLPEASVGHIGLFRDERTLSPVSYYEKMPNLASAMVLLADPMLATGGSAVQAVDELRRSGAGQLRFVCLIAAPEGVARLSEAHPDVAVYAAAVDERLNHQGFIVPGLGDAGDRAFGTA